MFAVQQIPKLSTGAAFYLRKYKVYIEDFFLASSQQHHMFAWGEVDGKKGPNDILSAFFTFLSATVPDTRHLICWYVFLSSPSLFLFH